jgi:hypothetical protein
MRLRNLASALGDFFIQEKGERRGCLSRSRVKEINAGSFEILGFRRKGSLGRTEKGFYPIAFRFRA